MVSRSLASGILVLVLSLLGAFAARPAQAVQATQDTTAPGLPYDLRVRPYSATTENQFVISMRMPDDESLVDRIHYTIDVPPTSPADGSSDSTETGEFDVEEFLVINAVGTHTVYIWLEDGENNQDVTQTVSVRIFNEGSVDQVLRVGERDRYATSAAISRKLYPDDRTASSVILVNGERGVDALGAVPLAVEAGSPVLFTQAHAIPPAVWEEIQRVVKPGSVIYLIGGEAAIDANQESFLKTQGYIVQRLGGETRDATAVAIAQLLRQMRGDYDMALFLVNGHSLPDGLSVAPAASRYPGPVMLTDVDGIPEAAFEYIKASTRESGLKVVYVIGGRDVISDDVIQQLSNVNIFAFRIAGPDRFATSATIASIFFSDTTVPTFGLANGLSIIDALSGGVHMAAQEAPILLVKQGVEESRCLPTARYLSLNATGIEGGYAYGGTAAIADETVNFAQDLMSGQATTGC